MVPVSAAGAGADVSVVVAVTIVALVSVVVVPVGILVSVVVDTVGSGVTEELGEETDAVPIPEFCRSVLNSVSDTQVVPTHNSFV